MKKNDPFLKKLLMVLPLLFLGYVGQAQSVTLIPDSNFEQALIAQSIDTDGIVNGQVFTADISSVTFLSVNSLGILDLTGIEDFTSLTQLRATDNDLTSLDVSSNTSLNRLDVDSNQLTSLDVSSNTSLITLYVNTNQLTSLDVSSNTSLTTFNVDNNQLTSLDVSSNTSLTTLNVDNNQLTSLDVSSNTSLTTLDVENNQLTSLDVSSNTSLTSLSAVNNQLTSLDVSSNTSLITLFVNTNQLTSLDVSSNTSLTSLNVSSNQLTSLDVSSNTSLTRLNISRNQLTSLDVSSNTSLTTLNADNNQLTSLDVSSNTSLTFLDVRVNQLTSLDVSSNTSLTRLIAGNNQLTSLDVSSNTSLTRLDVRVNQLTSLDVSSNTSLTRLDVRVNQLTSLDVSSNTSLTTLNADNNQLTSLDVSSNTSLITLFVNTNQLTSLNIQNGANTLLTTFQAISNPALLCIQVDAIAFADANFTNIDSQSIFSLDCRPVTLIPDTNFEQALIDQSIDTDGVINGQVFTADIENVTQLNINSLGISGLTGIEDFVALTDLSVFNNQLSSIDVSANTALTILALGANQLSSIDVSVNTDLTDLSVDNNQLNGLDVSANTALTFLNASDNPIANLDVSNNIALTVLSVGNNPILSSLDVSANTTLTDLFATNMPNLDCIGVADEIAANAGTGIYTNWSKDAATGYSETCCNNDTEAPTAICQNVIIELDQSGQAILNANQMDNGSSDNCGAVSTYISNGSVIGNSFGGQNSNNFGQGQSFTANETGVLTKVQFYAVGNSSNRTLHFYNSSTGSGISGSIGSPDYSETGVEFVDESNRTIYTEVELTKPFPVVAGNQYSFVIEGNSEIAVFGNDIYSGGAYISEYDLSSGCCVNSDMTFLLTIAVESLSYSCSSVGVNQVSLVVIDESGNRDSCIATVTVEDNIAPTLFCVADININCNVGIDLTNLASTDGCGIVSAKLSANGETIFDSVFVAQQENGSQPRYVKFGPDGNMYVSNLIDGIDGEIVKYDGITGAFIAKIGGPSGSTSLNFPRQIDFGPDGNLYVASNRSGEVLRFDPNTGSLIDVFVASGTSGQTRPAGLILGPDNNLYVGDTVGDVVRQFNGTTGAYIQDFVSSGSGGLDFPSGLEFGPDNNLYVTDTFSDSVKRYDGLTGAYIDDFVADIDFPSSLAFGPNGNLYAAARGGQILSYDGSSGTFIKDVTTFAPSQAFITGVSFGPDGNLYACVSSSGRIVRYPLSIDLATGTTVVTYEAVDNNENSAACSFNVTIGNDEDCDPLSVVDFNAANIYVGPNPMGAVLTIELNNTANLLNVSLFDITGKKLLSSTANIVSVDALAKGIYLVKVTTDKGAFIKKLVKN